jgi:hypothetical protein
VKQLLSIVVMIISFNANSELLDRGRRYFTLRLNYDMECTSFDCYYNQRTIKRDSNKCIVNFETIQQFPQHFKSNVEKIKGRMQFVSFIPLPYKYDLVNLENGGVKVRVKIHFRKFQDFSEKQRQFFLEYLDLAAKYWQDNHPFEFPVEFEFLKVDSKKEAHFSVRVLDRKTRGPYFMRWGIDWSHYMMAHEIGHMMGLDDEYKQVTNYGPDAKYCDQSSLMCNQTRRSKARPKLYHYYLILRRGLCHLADK